jgi:SAM-dependent methyltransferase
MVTTAADADDRPGVTDRQGDAAAPGSLLDSQATLAADRFAALSDTFDDWTRRRLLAVGLRAGWTCWEVGAGGPRVPAWLAEQVGSTGRVVATDIDVTWMPADAPFEVRRHDVAADAPPEGGFDLVHVRLVLTHVAARAEALRRMAAALRPGGWLVVEDFDVSIQPRACPDAATEDEDRANRVRAGFVELLVSRGVDPVLGRTLRKRLVALGLADVGGEAYAPLAGPSTRALEQTNTLQVRDALVGLGLGPDVDRHLEALAARRIEVATPPLVTAWGRRAA